MADTFKPGTGQNNPTAGDDWLDPAAVLSLAATVQRDVTLDPGVPLQILQRDPERVAFILLRGSSLTAFPRVCPFSDVSVFGPAEDGSVYINTYVLQDWLSLITYEWWALSGTGGPLRIVEFETPTNGNNNVLARYQNRPATVLPFRNGRQ